ncbi:MAG: tetratricopeptide repeat protein [Chloroflexi bacterium]|nr:tetratricopeptide repeat protein [Chloroflexota bacterium]
MLFRQLARDLTRRLPEWDASAKLSLAIAVTLLLALLALGFFGPDVIRLPARIGAFGLLISIQLLFLWANRRDVSPFHQAQQHFIAGEYQAARSLLEAIPERGRASVDALVLLGNTYRNLGQFEMCQAALQRALAIKPQHALAHYSVGKLNLARGEYERASECFQRAIEAGAPDRVKFELGLAAYLLGKPEAAERRLSEARSALVDDPAHLLLLQYILFALNLGGGPDTALIRENLVYWHDEKCKYMETPYGDFLTEVVRELSAQLAST